MSAPQSDADRARSMASRRTDTAGVYATLALADAIHRSASLLAGALVEAARIRAGKRS
jgi:hypothetical protein